MKVVPAASAARAGLAGTLARRGSNLLLQLLHAAIHGGDAAERAYRDVFTASRERNYSIEAAYMQA